MEASDVQGVLYSLTGRGITVHVAVAYCEQNHVQKNDTNCKNNIVLILFMVDFLRVFTLLNLTLRNYSVSKYNII